MDEDILEEDLDNIIDIYWHESAFYITYYIGYYRNISRITNFIIKNYFDNVNENDFLYYKRKKPFWDKGFLISVFYTGKRILL